MDYKLKKSHQVEAWAIGVCCRRNTSMCVHKLNSIKDYAHTAIPKWTWIFIFYCPTPNTKLMLFFSFLAESWNHQVAAAATCSEEVSRALRVQLEITWHPISSPRQATLKMETVSWTHPRCTAVHRFSRFLLLPQFRFKFKREKHNL